jgi:hypothetical protein
MDLPAQHDEGIRRRIQTSKREALKIFKQELKASDPELTAESCGRNFTLHSVKAS